MIEYYQKKLRVIQHILGANWLANKNSGQKSPPKPGRHPAQKFFKLAQDILGGPGQDLLRPSVFELLADIDELAGVLQIVSKLEGFNDLMLPKLKEKKCADQYQSLLHECGIASRHAMCGQQVRFVPTLAKEGIRTPDIAISMAGTTVRIECKRRQRIQPLRITDEKKKHLQSRIGTAFDHVRRNLDFLLFVHGQPDDTLLEDALSRLIKFAESGGIGRQSFPDAGIWFFVKDRPAPPTGWTNKVAGLPYDGQLDPAGVFQIGFTAENGDGDCFRLQNWHSGNLFFFSSHAFKQLTYSFDQGRKQFSPNEVGAICIDVDPAGMSRPALDWYLALMGVTLADYAWRGGQNIRIGALTLMTGPVRQRYLRDGCEVLVNEHPSCDVLARPVPGTRPEDSPVYKVFDQLPGQIERPNAFWADYSPKPSKVKVT